MDETITPLGWLAKIAYAAWLTHKQLCDSEYGDNWPPDQRAESERLWRKWMHYDHLIKGEENND